MKGPPSVGGAASDAEVGVDWGARPINFRVQFLDASGDVITPLEARVYSHLGVGLR
jgi:hypothetical protein